MNQKNQNLNSTSLITPAGVLKNAIKAVPAVKYALGVAGVAAAVALIAGFITDYKIAVFGIILMFGLMIVLVVFSNIAKSTVGDIRPLSLLLAWSFVILIIATSFFIFTGFFFHWPRPLESYIGEVQPASTPAPEGTNAKQVLKYFLTVQRVREGKPYGEPFTYTGEGLLETGWRLKFNISCAQPGYLYLLNQGPSRNGINNFVMLFPTPLMNNSLASLPSDQSIQIPPNAWFIVNDNIGDERLWIVWSIKPIDELEAVKGVVNPQDRGNIKDRFQIQTVREFLTKHESFSPTVEKDRANKVTVLRSSRDVLAYPIDFEHP